MIPMVLHLLVSYGFGLLDHGLLLQIVKRGTNNSASNLRGLSRPLLRDTLVLTLLVQSAPGLGPLKLSRLLALVNHGLAFGARDDNGLTIPANELHSMTGVDSILAERAEFSFDNHSVVCGTKNSIQRLINAFKVTKENKGKTKSINADR